MSSLKEMAAEYRKAAAKLRMYIDRRKAEGAEQWELDQLYQSLRDIRDTAHLLSGYYDVPHSGTGASVGWVARRTRDDH